MSDERSGLPSASSAHRYAVCPGSFLLEQTITEPEKTSEDANTGNRIHARLAGEQIELTDDELGLAIKCTNHAENLATAVFGSNLIRVNLIREIRLWSLDENLVKVWSGKPDVVYHDKRTALVIDYKTGRGEVEKATGNRQLRALAVLVDENFGPFEKIVVAIIQPLAGDPSVCEYTAEDLGRAQREIQSIMASVQKQGQARKATLEGCKYCRAKSVCPEAQEVVEKLPALAPRDGLEIVMSPEQIAAFLEKAPLAEAVIDAVRGKARRMLEAGHAVPGWKLKPGTIRESITKPEVVFGRFVEAGGTQEQFTAAISITKTGLKAAVKAATGAKGKDLDARLEGMLEGCTESKQTAPSLVQEKEAA